MDLQRRHAHAAGVHLGDLVAEAVAAQAEDEAIVLHGVDPGLEAGHLDAVQGVDEGDGGLRGDAAGATVDDVAVGVDGAEVAAGGDIALLQIDVDAQGLQDAAADEVLHRVVTEEAQVAGAAARSDAGKHRHREAAGALLGQPVQVRDVGGLQLRPTGLRVRQAAQAIRHKHDDGRRGADDDVPQVGKVDHARSS